MKDRSLEEEQAEKLFEAATELFGERGYNETTMEAIAEEAGSSKGAIYYYFDSKEELFLELLYDWLDRFKEVWDEMEKEDSPPEKLVGLHSAMMPLIGESPSIGRLLVEFWANAGRREEIEEALDEWLSEFRRKAAAVIRNGVDRGDFREVDPRQASFGLVAAYDGLWLHWLLAPSSFPLEEVGREFIDNFIRGLRTENSEFE